jgi:hypothetical protein
MGLGDFPWTAVISSTALLVAVTNAYYSFFRKARLRPRFGETLMLQLAENERLRVIPELMLHNPGSPLAVVHQLSWELRSLSDDSRQSLIWEENLTTVFSEVDGHRKTDTRFESFPSTLSIPDGDAISKRLQLATGTCIPIFQRTCVAVKHPSEAASGTSTRRSSRSAFARSSACSPGKTSFGVCCFALSGLVRFTMRSRRLPTHWSICGTTAAVKLAHRTPVFSRDASRRGCARLQHADEFAKRLISSHLTSDHRHSSLLAGSHNHATADQVRNPQPVEREEVVIPKTEQLRVNDEALKSPGPASRFCAF